MLQFKEQISKDFTPTSEIVPLAAVLAFGKPANTQNNSDIARQAFDLWQACNEERDKRVVHLAYRALARSKEAAKYDAIPKPKKHPVTHEDFLKLLIGGKSKSRRTKIYREYGKELIRRGRVSALANKRKISVEEAENLIGDEPCSLDEIDALMKGEMFRVFLSEELYRMAANDFLEWKAKQPTEQRKRAAKSRWEKEKRKKTIDTPQTPEK